MIGSPAAFKGAAGVEVLRFRSAVKVMPNVMARIAIKANPPMTTWKVKIMKVNDKTRYFTSISPWASFVNHETNPFLMQGNVTFFEEWMHNEMIMRKHVEVKIGTPVETITKKWELMNWAAIDLQWDKTPFFLCCTTQRQDWAW